MFVKSYLKKFILGLGSSVCLLLLGICLLCYNSPLVVSANTAPSYFSAHTNTGSYSDGSTIFLEDNQKFTISLGKPIDTSNLTESNSQLSLNEIGSYAVDHTVFESKVSLTINGVEKQVGNYENEINNSGYFPIKFVQYEYKPSGASAIILAYFEMIVDLSVIDGNTNEAVWESGEYVLTFSNYIERSGQYLGTTNTYSFSVTFYIFQNNEYFSDNQPNLTFENVEQAMPNTVNFRNYYFYNYNNLNIIGNQTNYAQFPSLTFDAKKFIIELNKSANGTQSFCTVGKDRTGSGSLTTLGENTTSDFVLTTIENDMITIYFTDIGEYVIHYIFIYESTNVPMVVLNNAKIENVQLKNDVLYVYGYQMFYSGNQETTNNEFKHITNGQTSSSADITYTIAKDKANILKANDLETVIDEYNNNDQTIKNIITEKNLKPVSTNQPLIKTTTNANLQVNYSYYYTLNTNNNTWNSTKYPFNNSLFASSGTYLLKAVYSFDNYYTNQGISNGYFFTQYFYFKITNINPTINIEDMATGEKLNTNSYTKNGVRLTLPAQSIYNSPLTAYIYSKAYSENYFSSENPTVVKAQTEDTYIEYVIDNEHLFNNKNYYVKLVYGKNQNSYQDIYFTIDNNSFTGVKFLPVDSSISNSMYVKDKTFNYISPNTDPVNYSFFTSDNVVVEWDEKPSGATSMAYYKYVPFKNAEEEVKKTNWVNNDKISGIPTTYQLDLDKTKIYDKILYNKSTSSTLVSGNNILTQAGFYVFYITDQAGNQNTLEFCIDKSAIQVWQYDITTSGAHYHNVHNYNVISQNAYVEWGNYKLIKINCTNYEIENIKDDWIKSAIDKIFKLNNRTNTKINTRDTSGELYFIVNISNTFLLQEGNSFSFKTGRDYYINRTSSLENSDYEFAIELTYVFYLIDEGNRYFTKISENNINNYIQNANKTYNVTTSSDMSGADVVINSEASSVNDVSSITTNSQNVLQAGYSDGRLKDTASSTYDSDVNLRTKYHFTTGSTINGDVSILSYIINLNPSDEIYVQKVTLYFYEFIKQNGVLTLSTVAVETVIYDRSVTPVKNLFTALSDSFASYGDFFGYNINTVYDSNTNSTRTANGKYVIVREYNSSPKSNEASKFDFQTRENVFIVDRESIVSSPESYNDQIKSYVGGDIFVNVLDGEENAKQFYNIYAAKNNETYILQTNKLPVSIYIPISKYGISSPTDKFFFNTDPLFDYFLQLNDDILLRYIYNDSANDSINTVEAKLKLIYFGSNAVVSENFANSSSVYKNNSFDLSIKITSINGTSISTTTSFNFNTILASARLTDYGIYYVEITQNAVYGKVSPNAFKTFSFSFSIIEQPPKFDFVDPNDQSNSQMCSMDINGVSYTNLDSIKVVWQDPNNEDYLSKIDISDNGEGFAKGIYFSVNGGSSQRVKIPQANNSALSSSSVYNQIFSSDDGKTHWFFINLANLRDNSILSVYMCYEGKIINSLTSVTRELYIDRQAPMTVVDELIAQTEIQGVKLAQLSRKYIDINGNTTLNEYRYNTPISSEYFPSNATTNHPLAYYSFAIKNDMAVLSSLLTSKIPTTAEKYYTNGYNYYIKQITDMSNYQITNIESAKNATVTHTVDLINLLTNYYYEVIESDLAGNISIYIIYIVGEDIGSTVLEYDKENTDYNTKNVVYFEELQQTQDLFVKTYFDIKKLDLYNYEFLEFTLDNTAYFKSRTAVEYAKSLNYENPELYVYNLSSWTDIAGSLPKLVKLSDIFNFTAPSKHTLTIIDPTKTFNYNFNIYVNEKELSSNLSQVGEGITIQANSSLNSVLLYPESIEIYSYNNNKYNLIYSGQYLNAEMHFLSNNLVTYSQVGNNFTFTVIAPAYAYKYVFIDNYGVYYAEYHTTNDVKLDPDEIVQNYLEEVIITDIVNGTSSTNSWYVSNQNIIFNYSATEYTAYVKIYTPSIQQGSSVVTWRLFEGYSKNTMTSSPDGVLYGYELARPTTRIGLNVDGVSPEIYCVCSKNNNYETINQVVLYNPLADLMEGFDGSMIKFEITLVSTREQNTSTNIIERFVINNMTPSINLKDKNDELQNELFEGGTLFTGQISIEIAELSASDNYLFNYYTTLTRASTGVTMDLVNGYVVTEADTYTINNYISINNVHYLIQSKAFVISASSNEFYSVVVKNPESQIYELVDATNKTFTHNNITYTKHYIVNSTDFDVLVNKNQDIIATLDTALSSNTTFIYHISNYNPVPSSNVSPYKIDIAISYIPSTTMILSEGKFTITKTDGQSIKLFDENEKGSYSDIIIDNDNNNMDYIIVKFNAYYSITENEITPLMYYGEDNKIVFSPQISYEAGGIKSFKISTSGVYTISFSDQAGNKQYFTDINNIYVTDYYTITFIKGVAYYINGIQPIQNGIYNDKVTITLPTILKNMYDTGGTPKIKIFKNGDEISLKANANNEYVIDVAGYYKVYFTAEVNGYELREESYDFLVLASNEYRTSFEFSEYGDYEIIKVVKNGQVKNYTNYFEYNYQTNGLKNIFVSLYDEKTGEGNYELTIATNSDILNEQFTFSFIVKHIGVVPITISTKEGEATTDTINIEFNAYDMYTDIGECKIVYGDNTVLINQEYLDSLAGASYYQNLSIDKAGTYFIQVYTSSDKLLYSYKVVKEDPLNAISIIVIIVSVLAVGGLVVTIVLLRKKMKIR